MELVNVLRGAMFVMTSVTMAACVEMKHDVRPMAVWDFDGTIIDGDCTEGLVREGRTVYVGLLEECIRAGFSRTYRGEEGVKRFREDYEAKIAAGRKAEAYGDCAGIFAGAEVAKIEEFCRGRFESGMNRNLFAFSLGRFRQLEKDGVENHVISASPDFFVQAAAKTLGIPRSRIHGIKVAIKDGKLTDKVIAPLPYGDGKVCLMREIERETGGKARFGFGNSYGTDGPFLKAIAEQGGESTMINGGKVVPGMTELFVCTNLTDVVSEQLMSVSVAKRGE